MKTRRGVLAQRTWALSMTLAALLVAARDASATIHTLTANMNGAQETPPVTTSGTGNCTVTLNDATGQVSVTGTYQNLTGLATAAHIHGPAPPGMPAGIIVTLTQTGGTSGTIGGGGTLTAAQVQDELNGLHYINLHTTAFGNGEIRGQILVPPSDPEEASKAVPMTLSKGAGTSVNVSYTPACGATDHVMYWGQAAGPITGSLNWTNSACGLGTTGSATFDPGDPAVSNFFYFVVVGQTASVQGSFGTNSSGVQRPEAMGTGLCDRPQSLNVTCP